MTGNVNVSIANGLVSLSVRNDDGTEARALMVPDDAFRFAGNLIAAAVILINQNVMAQIAEEDATRRFLEQTQGGKNNVLLKKP